MSDLISVPVVSPQAFLAAKAQARVELQQDFTMDKAADLVAQRNLLLQQDSIPPALKTAKLKQLNRAVGHWTRKARQPFGRDTATESVDNEMDAAPAQAMLNGLVNAIKQTASPAPSNSVATPPPKKKRKPRVLVTPPSKTPSTRKAKKKKPKTPLTGVEPLDEWETEQEWEEAPEGSLAEKTSQIVAESKKRTEAYKKRRAELKNKNPSLKKSLKEGAKEGAKKSIIKGVESFFGQKGSGAVLPWIEF